MDAGGQDPLSWYKALPLISRMYLTGAVLTSAACYLDFVSPLTLYFNYDLIFNRGHYWRLISSFLFFGPYSLDFVFHMFFVIRYCRLLEEGKFRERTADLLVMLMFGVACMVTLCMCFEIFSKIKFLGHSLSFMMVYVWARDKENEHMRMQLLGLYTFRAPYLPWVLFLFSLFLRNPPGTDLLGIIVGHLYYFLDTVYPIVASVRGWRVRRLIQTPYILQYMLGYGAVDMARGGLGETIRVRPADGEERPWEGGQAVGLETEPRRDDEGTGAGPPSQPSPTSTAQADADSDSGAATEERASEGLPQEPPVQDVSGTDGRGDVHDGLRYRGSRQGRAEDETPPGYHDNIDD